MRYAGAKILAKYLTGAAFLMASGFSGATGFAACDTEQVVEIEIVNMAFSPKNVEICAGQTVRWTNTEPTSPRRIIHTVTADPALARNADSVSLPEGAETFHSGLLAPGASFEHTFTVTGHYKYFCQPHERMGHVATIDVVAAE